MVRIASQHLPDVFGGDLGAGKGSANFAFLQKQHAISVIRQFMENIMKIGAFHTAYSRL